MDVINDLDAGWCISQELEQFAVFDRAQFASEHQRHARTFNGKPHRVSSCALFFRDPHILLFVFRQCRRARNWLWQLLHAKPHAPGDFVDEGAGFGAGGISGETLAGDADSVVVVTVAFVAAGSEAVGVSGASEPELDPGLLCQRAAWKNGPNSLDPEDDH